MKKLILTLTYLLSTVALLTQTQTSVAAEQTTVAGSNLELNGVGVHSELRKEWFLNALYLTSKTDDAEDVVSTPGIKRMELRVLADSLSGRRLKRFWIERIKNNNEASSVLANAKSVRDFANLMDNDLVAGDIVTIDALSSATVVSINGSEIGRTDAAAFPLILRTWVGSRPPSSEFKEAILGDVSSVQRSELIARLNTIQPSQARVAMFDTAAIKAREEEERKQREEEERKKREEEERKKQEELQKLEEQQKLADQKAQAEEAQKAEEVAEAERLRRELEEARRLLAEQQAAAEAAKGPTEAEIAAMRAKYSDQLGAHYVPYFEYPQRDILRRHGKSALMRPRKGKTHGDVSISIEVDREGDLVGGALVSSSGEKILDDAVMNALFDSVPFPAMPEDLPGETFKTTVSISIPAPQM
jgi:colicin import membrane protein